MNSDDPSPTPTHGRLRRRPAVPAGVILLVAGAIAAGCTSSPPSGSHARTTSSTSTTTTLSLAPSIDVGGTDQAGSLSFLGPVMRVQVQAVPAGRTAPPPTTSAPPLSTLAGSLAPLPPRPVTVTIAYREFGTGTDLVLVMGQDGSMTWWASTLLQDLSQHFRVTVFDLPGIGFSGVDAAQASVERYADVTAGLVDALGLTHPVLLGWGLGGGVALEVAVRHSGLASKLVLVDTSAGGLGSVPTTPAVSALLASPATTVTRLAALIFPPGAPGARLAWLRQTQMQSPDDVVAAGITSEAAAEATWWRTGAVSSDLAGVAVPVLVVQGMADMVFASPNSAQLAAELPQASLLKFPGGGYAALFQYEPQFVTHLVAFAGT